MNHPPLLLSNLLTAPLPPPKPERIEGQLLAARGTTLRVGIPRTSVGDLCTIDRAQAKPLLAQVIGFDSGVTLLAPLDEIVGVRPGARVTNLQRPISLNIAQIEPGSRLGALGESLAGSENGSASDSNWISLRRRPPPPLERTHIARPLETGIAAIDTFIPLGYGQRIAIASPAGVGKSSLLSSIATFADVDLCVAALIGERGREVREFIDTCPSQTITVAATADEPSLRRVLAAHTATTIAEWYRDRGLRVLLLVDSLTRFARALREVHLAAGEIPVRQGYPPSVYTELPALLERAGTNAHGSITAIYTLLFENEKMSDPIVEEAISLLDGHIVLSRSRALEGVHPAIDIPSSISRLAHRILPPDRLEVARLLRRNLERVAQERELIALGGVQDESLRTALRVSARLAGYLNQHPHERKSASESWALAHRLATESVTSNN